MKKARKQPIYATTPMPRGRSGERSHEEMQMSMKGREARRESLFDAKAGAIAIDIAREGF
jgi:hypothetical protein